MSEDYTAMNEKTCKSIAAFTLTKGITVFRNYFNQQVRDIISDSKEKRYESLSYSDIYEFEKGIKLVDGINVMLAQAWARDSQELLDQNTMVLVITLLVCTVLQIMIFDVLRNRILGNLSLEYTNFKRLFNAIIPQSTLEKEKRIYAQLRVNGVLPM